VAEILNGSLRSFASASRGCRRTVAEGVKERLRAAVRDGVERTLEDRLEAAVRSAISERLMARQFGGARRGSVQVEEHSPDNNSARWYGQAP